MDCAGAADNAYFGFHCGNMIMSWMFSGPRSILHRQSLIENLNGSKVGGD
jgi:hypothetical protein